MKAHIFDPRQPEFSLCGRPVSCEAYQVGVYHHYFTLAITKGTKPTCATCAKILDRRLK